MRNVSGKGKVKGLIGMCMAASAAVLLLASGATAGGIGGKNFSNIFKPETTHKDTGEAREGHFEGWPQKQCDWDSLHKQFPNIPYIVLINDGRGTTKLMILPPQQPFHPFHFPSTLTANISADPYPGFKFVQWMVYGNRDSVTLGSPTAAKTTVTVKSVSVTIMALFQDINGANGGGGGGSAYPNTCGPGDNMTVDGSAIFGATNTDKTFETVTVNGRIKCDGLKIQNWLFTQKAPPDYVFGKNYKLIDLDRVEEYIKANGHLPEMPSAAEMQKSGVDITEFNMALLKKIEELTLYTIELKKKVDLLKNQK
jgi:hypothetical protein